ncbi:PQQ-dependent dehydrogenase, methanol/ethanol family [Comamonas testosteroni]|uniref:PQQ-dependent dehydrogenase, methanol/ethanol family n=1 Tax=Comamonas testosteroni TaxID=285 RepID=UPI0026F00F4D|nr:PQQ-dependent dehydrogenase, methanol/ethanol family [Comamonas testosteroni]WQD44650.1 PQQ-dependent dehydrogenase, methanol/ethanol family [Comamonas testosteroni]
MQSPACIRSQHRQNRRLVTVAVAGLLGWLSILALAAEQVDDAHIEANARTGKDWPSHGLNYQENRFSPLKQIHSGNVDQLGLAWSYKLDSSRGVEATPVVVNGVMYVSAPWSVVHAVDARTGKALWTYDPQVPREMAYKGCCDVVNRGVAVYKGKVFVGAFDGRLIALDAVTGRQVWSTDTIDNKNFSYTITGAPRVFKGKVYIGNGGAEYGARGYVTAYDAETGKQVWRFYTVPGDPAQAYESKALEEAAKTWDPAGRYWESGGGGTVWNSLVFDPELNQMYIGVGNGSPWAHRKRSPAGGDNLYLGSIVALDPDTGAYQWHYQETPGDNWDFTSSQDIVQADIRLDGKLRKVLLHAPKNGYFFVIDRRNGQFISARNFVPVNWARGYDARGRPIMEEGVRVAGKAEIIPGPLGAHNWHSMAYSPQTGLAYIPAQHIPTAMADDPDWTGFNSNTPGQFMSNNGWNTGRVMLEPRSLPFGRLIAWDPVRQKEVWHQKHVSPWNGGTLVTDGDLVFQGTADARLVAYHARSGKKLWDAPMGSGVIAAPVSYELDGRQYVSIAVGWGGAFGLGDRVADFRSPGTVYSFALGGKAPMPERVAYQMNALIGGLKYDPQLVPSGAALYNSNCIACHGYPGVSKGGALPSLTYLPAAMIDNLGSFIINGPATSRGMPDFAGKLSDQDVQKLRAFILAMADAVRPGLQAEKGR